jgi:hypothetical protein
MPHIPNYKQRRYRGRLRNDMRSAFKHLKYLLDWNARYLGKPLNYYPNQLAAPAEMAKIEDAYNQLDQWLGDQGPIPSRAP